MSEELENTLNDEEPIVTEAAEDGGWEPEPPTPEQEEEWDRERKEREAALIKPYEEIAQAMKDRDELIADILFEITMNEMEDM